MSDDRGGFLGQGGIGGVPLLIQLVLICRVFIGGRVLQVVHVITGNTEGSDHRRLTPGFI